MKIYCAYYVIKKFKPSASGDAIWDSDIVWDTLKQVPFSALKNGQLDLLCSTYI